MSILLLRDVQVLVLVYLLHWKFLRCFGIITNVTLDNVVFGSRQCSYLGWYTSPTLQQKRYECEYFIWLIWLVIEPDKFVGTLFLGRLDRLVPDTNEMSLTVPHISAQVSCKPPDHFDKHLQDEIWVWGDKTRETTRMLLVCCNSVPAREKE